MDGRHVQDGSAVCVAIRGVSPHVFIHANDTHAFTPFWNIDQQARPCGQESGVGGIPGRAEGLGDARHRQMMNDHARQRPAHSCTRERGTRIGRVTHVLGPHVSALLARVAAYTRVHNRGTPPAGLMSQAHDHRVTRNALAPAASTPPILTSNTASQHCRVWLNALTRHFQPQVIQASARAQIEAITDSTGNFRSFR